MRSKELISHWGMIKVRLDIIFRHLGKEKGYGADGRPIEKCSKELSHSQLDQTKSHTT